MREDGFVDEIARWLLNLLKDICGCILREMCSNLKLFCFFIFSKLIFFMQNKNLGLFQKF